METAYDLVVVGSGPAGQSAAELAAFLGHSALIVERRRPGGVVTTTGGAPTKTLREAALALAGNRGLSSMAGEAVSFRLEDVLPTVREQTIGVCRSLQEIVAGQIAARGIAYIEGEAKLGADRTVTIATAAGRRVEIAARTIVLATGSRPVHVPGVPFDDPDVYDSDAIFGLRRTPRDIVIVGGGAVGVEFATIFTALGVPVTLIEHGARLLANMDAELVALMTAEFTRQGVRLLLETSVESVVRQNDQLIVAVSRGVELETGAVLFATGRSANAADLGLEEAGVELDERGRIVVDRYFQTTRAGIYAVGDVVAPTLASIAMQQGRAAVCHALGFTFGVPVDRAASSAVYGLPELAGVGVTEEQIQKSGTPYVAGRCDLSRTARGAIAGRGGRLKLIVRADDRKLLGVHCIGDIASELVGMGHAVLHLGGSIDVFLTLALNTPTYSAAYREAAIDALARLAELAAQPTVSSRPVSQPPRPAFHTTGARS